MVQLKPSHLFLAVGALWIAIAAFLIFSSPPRPEFFQDVQTRDFRMALYDRGPESCIALASLDRLDILVVGNSHVHSGIDAEEVARAFPGRRTGVCGLGTFRPERFTDLFNYLDAHDLSPRRIIWVVDPYMISRAFSDLDGAAVQSVFFDPAVRAGVASDWASALAQDAPLLGETADDIERRLAFHRDQMEALDLETVTTIIRDNTLQHEAYSQGLISRFDLNPSLSSDLAEICALTEARRVRIDLLAAPAGPFDLIEHDLDIGGIALDQAVDHFAEVFPCERRYMNRTLPEWGLDIRYRINRGLDDGFDYTLFSDAEAFTERYAALPSNRQRHQAYDTSHLNRVGAAIFTERAMRALNEG